MDLREIPPFFIRQPGRCRLVIDAQAFQTITTDCHLKQASVRQSGARWRHRAPYARGALISPPLQPEASFCRQLLPLQGCSPKLRRKTPFRTCGYRTTEHRLAKSLYSPLFVHHFCLDLDPA